MVWLSVREVLIAPCSEFFFFKLSTPREGFLEDVLYAENLAVMASVLNHSKMPGCLLHRQSCGVSSAGNAPHAGRTVILHGHRHVDWIGISGETVLCSSPSVNAGDVKIQWIL